MRLLRSLFVLGSAMLAAACTVSAQNPAAPGKQATNLDTDPHLVAWWTFDQTSGTELKDSSAGNHPGVLEGGTTLESCSVPGHNGKALKFDGKEAFVRIPNYKGITGQNPRTVALWIKTTAQSGDLVSWGSDEPGKRFNFGFFRSRVGIVPKGGYLYMNPPVHDDQWHHVAVVVHEASPPNLHDHVKLFKDGDRAEIGDIGLLDLWPIDTGDKLEVRIGRRFNGVIDDLRIYDRALSEDEITALFRPDKGRRLTQSR